MRVKKNNIEKGFTLIEMLMTVFIFSIVFGSASALFVSAVRNQSRALASQQLLSETSFIMEYMGRAMRMAVKDDIGGVDCIPSGNRVNYATTTSGVGGIRFRNYLNQCQEFYKDCSSDICRLRERKGANDNFLTSPNLDVLAFYIIEDIDMPTAGWSQDDTLQPRVTFFLEIKKAGTGNQPKIKIQTTVSQRRLDIEE